MIEILLKVAKEHPNVFKKPKPVVFLLDLATLVLTLKFQCGYTTPSLRSVLPANLIKQSGKLLPTMILKSLFPRRDLHIRNISSCDKLP